MAQTFPSDVTMTLSFDGALDGMVVKDERGTIVGHVSEEGKFRFTHIGKELLSEQVRINVEAACRDSRSG